MMSCMTALTFGDVLTAQSAAPVAYVSSGDGKTFTATYSDYQVQIGDGTGTPTVMAARWEWFSVSVSTHQHSDPFTVIVSGSVSTESGPPGAWASLLISVDGEVDVTDFPAGTDVAFTRTVDAFTDGFQSELQIAVGVVLNGDRGFAAELAVDTVNGETAP
jgi:hypothetical protein